MLQQDMTGFVQRTLDAGQAESVGVITDFVDPDLTDFIKKVIVEVSLRRLNCETGLDTNHPVSIAPFRLSRQNADTPALIMLQLPRPAIPLPS
jgi:hypothetical protein